MIVVDSCGWLEYFADGPNADAFAEAIEGDEELVVPTITVLEVVKVMARERGERAAAQAVAHMRRGRVVELTEQLACDAARCCLVERLPLADAVVLTTARGEGATVWTQDEDFEGKDPVRYFPR